MYGQLHKCRFCGQVKWGKDPCTNPECTGRKSAQFTKRHTPVICVTKGHGFHAPVVRQFSYAIA